ncbi:N-acetylmuramoyl-L-alanine amidase [Nocardia thailandica]|uniref:N-acetylmuramoyl-L-alanine amidase n=1 Tax=Nocardia thailandica TaxID=257275 RepID=UPI0002DC6066
MKPNIIKAGLGSAVAVAVAAALTTTLPAAHSAPATPEAAGKLAGKTIFLDPGHQGSAHSEDLTRQVDNGRGGLKDCQTTGMTSLHGVPEHTINWDVSQLVRAALEALGAQVVLSRADDAGWGGCVDDRARVASDSGAAVAVSIHADSAPAAERGFHLIVPELPVPDAVVDQVQAGPGRAASTAVRDAYVAAGFSPATYAGVREGLQVRADVAGPALTRVPLVFLEMGNGANAEDASLLETREGQLKHAIAITTGLVGYLLDTPVTTPVGAHTPGGVVPAVAPDATEPGTGEDTTPTTTRPHRVNVGTGSADDPGAPPSTEPSAPEEKRTAPTTTTTPAPAAVAPTTTPSAGDTAPTTTTAPPAAAEDTGPTTTTPPATGQADGTTITPPATTTPAPAATTTPGVAPARAPIAHHPPVAPVRTAPGGSTTTATKTEKTPLPQNRGVAPKSEPKSGGTDFPSSLGNLATEVLDLLMPLATALGMDNSAVTSELIDLAYTLAGMVFGPTK